MNWRRCNICGSRWLWRGCGAGRATPRVLWLDAVHNTTHSRAAPANRGDRRTQPVRQVAGQEP